MPTNDPPSATATFGPNLWLVEEMYQLFLDDPSAVDASWHEFFADYQPASAGEGGRADTTTPTAAPLPPGLRRRSPRRGVLRRLLGRRRRRRRRAPARRCGVRRRRW